MKKNCTVLAIYEGDKAREAAQRFCDDLSRRFWNSFEIKTLWLDAEDLVKQALKHKASKAVCESDILVFSLKDQSLPHSLFMWLETALAKRCEKEGYLALLSANRHCRNELVLRNMAHRAGLDFITDLPPSLGSSLPESPEPYSTRAHEVSGLMADILQRQPPPAPPAIRPGI